MISKEKLIKIYKYETKINSRDKGNNNNKKSI